MSDNNQVYSGKLLGFGGAHPIPVTMSRSERITELATNTSTDASKTEVEPGRERQAATSETSDF